jgi:sulfite reductase (ferredoxin)
MADKGNPSHLEHVKKSSNFLRGSIASELVNGQPVFSEDNCNLLKTHGTYQQDDRDSRKTEKHFMFMVRSRVPGGKVSAAQFLGELDLCDQYGNGTLRITDRQGFQLHGILKDTLKETIRGISAIKLSTLAACGDVCRNVMCCPAPVKNNSIHDEMQAFTDALAHHFRPRTSAYYEIWLKDGDQSELVHETKVDHEPIYGDSYLPRKFKIGVTLPEDNCIDVYTQDMGYIAVVEKGKIIGYNVLAGGGMGMTPAKKTTFPALAKRLCFVTPDEAIAVGEAVVKVQRDFGNREDRKQARLKYLIHDRGLDWFREKVAEYYGQPLKPLHDADVTDVDDHIGWHEQGDGKLFLGINIENGRLKDEGPLRLKAMFRTLLTRYGMNTRLTALQGVILCDVDPKDKADINKILADHGCKQEHELTLTRRYSIACPAYPTCGLAVTEAERVMPTVMDEIEAEMAKYGLTNDRITIHMTGCPNGCARPYTPDIGLVGKARNKYTVYLGGNAQGTRLAFLYQDMVNQEDVAKKLSPIFARYKTERQSGESFGDYCHRLGPEAFQDAPVAVGAG